MLTSDDIRKAAQKFYDDQEFQCGWGIGAGWANEKNETELATLRAENARLRDALEGVLRVANVRIDDQRIAQFDAARTALNSAKPDPLYAAAPEMLKALEMIENLQSKTRICFDASDAESMWDTLQEVFIIASNPIAKLYKAI